MFNYITFPTLFLRSLNDDPLRLATQTLQLPQVHFYSQSISSQGASHTSRSEGHVFGRDVLFQKEAVIGTVKVGCIAAYKTERPPATGRAPDSPN